MHKQKKIDSSGEISSIIPLVLYKTMVMGVLNFKHHTFFFITIIVSQRLVCNMTYYVAFT